MTAPMGGRPRDAEHLIGGVLRGGVLISALVVLAGAGLYLARHGQAFPHYGVFRGEPSDLRTLGGILADTLALRARGLIQLGLLLLIATPVARVALSVAVFALERDRTYVAVTLVVLALLLFSLLGSS